MKKIIRNALTVLLIVTVPACYTKSIIISSDKMKDYDALQIISIQTKDGRTIENNSKLKLYNSDKGISIVDSAGTKFYRYCDLSLIQVMQFDTLHTIILAAGLGAAVYISLIIYAFATLKVS